MKTKHLLFIYLALTSCNKDAVVNSVNSSTVLSATLDTAKIPLIDMGSKTYLGYNGYLYPNLSNQPLGQYATDLHNFCISIVPLDSLGSPDSLNGRIGFISIGASTCAIMMNALTAKTEGNPLTNPKLLMATCTSGAESINEIMDPKNRFWNTVTKKLQERNLKAKQVEVAYLETEDSVSTNGFPERPLRTKTEYQKAMRTFKTKFPNIKLVYLLGRPTTFLAGSKVKMPNLEPCPYYNGWACKWVIEDQINGVSGTAYKGTKPVSPLVTWGWYEWTDGSAVPRSDGFTWQKEDTGDGLHANEAGADTLSTYFQNFLLTDPNASIWYANHN